MLKLKQQSQEEDSLIIESQSLSFTHKSLKIKSQSYSPQVTPTETDGSPKLKQPFALLVWIIMLYLVFNIYCLMYSRIKEVHF